MFSNFSEHSVSGGGSVCEPEDGSTNWAPGCLPAADCAGRAGGSSCQARTGRRHLGPEMEECIQGPFSFRTATRIMRLSVLTPPQLHLLLFFSHRLLSWTSQCSSIPPLHSSRNFLSLSSTRRSWRPPRCTWKVSATFSMWTSQWLQRAARVESSFSWNRLYTVGLVPVIFVLWQRSFH